MLESPRGKNFYHGGVFCAIFAIARHQSYIRSICAGQPQGWKKFLSFKSGCLGCSASQFCWDVLSGFDQPNVGELTIVQHSCQALSTAQVSQVHSEDWEARLRSSHPAAAFGLDTCFRLFQVQIKQTSSRMGILTEVLGRLGWTTTTLCMELSGLTMREGFLQLQ